MPIVRTLELSPPPFTLGAGPHLNLRLPSLLMKKLASTRSLLLLFVALLALSQTPELLASRQIKGPPDTSNDYSLDLLQYLSLYIL
jgi:hypothetical protein